MNSAFTVTPCYRFHHRLLVLKKSYLTPYRTGRECLVSISEKDILKVDLLSPDE